jgi:hypothetical protein
VTVLGKHPLLAVHSKALRDLPVALGETMRGSATSIA